MDIVDRIGVSNAKKIILACTDCGSRNYSYESNQVNNSERLEIKEILQYLQFTYDS